MSSNVVTAVFSKRLYPEWIFFFFSSPFAHAVYNSRNEGKGSVPKSVREGVRGPWTSRVNVS